MDRRSGRAGTRPALTGNTGMERAETRGPLVRPDPRTHAGIGGQARDWPVRFDHCFQRILLDNAVGGPWREHIDSPAYRNAPEPILARAIALGEAAVANEADLAELNRRSLAWRGKG